MTATPLTARPQAPMPEQRSLLLKLRRSHSGDVHVLACEIQGDNFTNQTVFHSHKTLSQIFVAPFAKAVAALLGDLSDRHHIQTIPRFVFELPGLTLATARMIVSEMADGSQRIVLRFQTFLGSFSPALIPRVGFGNAHVNDQERVAMDVLSDIALPLLNQVNGTQTPGSIAVYGGADKLHSHAHEIAFRMELLKRFIAGCARHTKAAPRPPQASLDAPEHIAPKV